MPLLLDKPHRLSNRFDGYLDYAITALLKTLVGRINFPQRIGMGDQWCCVQLAGSNQFQNTVTVAAVHPAGFEYQIFAIHIR